MVAALAWVGAVADTLRFIGKNDFLGLIIFPAMMMWLRPAIAILSACAGLAGAFFVWSSHPQRAFPILVKTAIVQALAAVVFIVSAPADRIAARSIPLFGDSRSPQTQQRMVALVAAQQRAAGVVLPGIVTAALGWLLLAVVARRERAVPELMKGAPALPDRFQPLPPAAVPAPTVRSAAAGSFRQASYEVRPRSRALVAFKRYESDYDIVALAHARSNQERYAYSMATGDLRVAPEGAVLLTVSMPAGASGILHVADSTGTAVARIEPRVTGWDIRHPDGLPLAHVIRHDRGLGRALYVASAEGGEVCRYTWSSGAAVSSPMVLVDFDARGTFDRGLALLVAPYIDEWCRDEDFDRNDVI
jgi:hypothetical protein